MVKGKIVRVASAAVASVGLVAATTGMVGASSGVISTTGYNSYNAIVSHNSSHVSTNTHTNLLVGSANMQDSYSGNAKADKNTTGGDVMTGASSNANTTKTDVMVTNPTPAAPMVMPGGGSSDSASIGTTGADSTNKIISTNTSDVHTNTTTNIGVLSYSQQQSSTGDASASKNTTTGSVSTGNSSNVNNTSTMITVQQ